MTTTLKSGTAFIDSRCATAFVSATSMGTDSEVRGMVRPRVPNYFLRRMLVGIFAVGITCVVAVGAVALIAGSGAPAAAAAATGAPEAAVAPTIHVAQPGDTMWSIAGNYRGSIAHDRYLTTLIALNGSSAVQAGQAVWLP